MHVMARPLARIGNLLRRPGTGSSSALASAPGPEAPHRLVLHLGSQKTGTTAVQAWCRRHTPELLSHGVAVRTTQPEIRKALGDRYELRHGDSAENLTTFLNDACRDARTSRLFYSCESNVGPAFQRGGQGLYPHLRDNIEAMARATADVERHVQFTVRDYAPFIESAYLQQLKHGHPVAFEDFVADIDPGVSWRPVVEHLVDVFGSDHVTVYDYEDPTPPVERILSDALELLGAGSVLDGTDWDHRTNERYTQRMADLSLMVLPHLRSSKERTAFHRFLENSLEDPADRPAEFFSPDRQEELSARYVSDMDWIREQWGIS